MLQLQVYEQWNDWTMPNAARLTDVMTESDWIRLSDYLMSVGTVQKKFHGGGHGPVFMPGIHWGSTPVQSQN